MPQPPSETILPSSASGGKDQDAATDTSGAGDNEDISPSSPSSQKQAPSGVTDTSALNTSIVQAVDKNNTIMLSASGPEGAGMAYQKVSQAAAYSVQDSTDYLRNIMTMAATTTGVCMQKMIVEKSPDPWAQIMIKVQEAVTAAQENFSAVGVAAADVVSSFPTKPNDG